MKIGDLVEAPKREALHLPVMYQRGILTNLSECGTMAWVAWINIGMKETRVPAQVLEVIA